MEGRSAATDSKALSIVHIDVPVVEIDEEWERSTKLYVSSACKYTDEPVEKDHLKPAEDVTGPASTPTFNEMSHTVVTK